MSKALVAARAGFRRLFSISAFTPPPPATVPPPAEPSTNLFISGLSKRTTSEGLREAFSKFGNLVQARVVTDRVSGYSKGFGFVKYATVEEAAEGIKGMDGKFLDGWVIFAEYAKPRPQLSQNQSQPSNYTSQTSQSWSSYRSSQSPGPHSSSPQPSGPLPGYSSYTPQASEPSQNYSSYTSQESQPPSNYSHHSPQTQSVPPSNYSSDTTSPPPSFASVQATNYSQTSEFQQGYARATSSWNPPPASQPPNYAPSSYASAPTFNHLPQDSHPTYPSMHGTSSVPSDSIRNSEMSENQTSEPSYNFDSGRAGHY